MYLGSLVLVLEPLGRRNGMEGHKCTCDVKWHQVEGGIGLLWVGVVGRSLGHTLQE